MILALGLVACDSGEFVRDNQRDPAGSRFSPEPAQEFSARLEGNLVKLRWEDRSDFEDGYRVERAIDDRPFETIAILPKNSIAYTDTLPLPLFEASYRVSVFAERNGVISGDTTSVARVVIADPAPHASLDLIDERTVEIRWWNEDIEGLELEIERRADGGSFETVTIADYGAGRYLDRFDIEPNTTYHFRVRGRIGEWRAPKYRTVAILPTPHPPEGLWITPHPDYVHFQWWLSDVHLGWTVERCIYPATDCSITKIERVSGSSSRPSFRDESVNPALKYRYRVKSLLSDYSHPLVVETSGSMSTERVLSLSNFVVDADRDGRLLLVRRWWEGVDIVDASTGLISSSIKREGTQTGAISGDGRRVAILGMDGHLLFVEVYDRATGTRMGERTDLYVFEGGTLPLLSMNESGSRAYIDSETLYAVSAEGGIEWTIQRALYGPTVSDPTDRFLVEIDFHETRIRSAPDGEIIRRLPIDCLWMTRWSFSRDAELFACSSRRGDGIEIRSLESGEIVRRMADYDERRAVAFSHDGRRLATIGSRGRIWDVETGEVLYHDPNVRGNAWTHMLFGTNSGDFWFTSENQVHRLVTKDNVWQVAQH